MRFFLKYFMVSFFSLGLASCAEMNMQEALNTGLQIGTTLAGPSTGEYAKGVKETLALSASRASTDLSKQGGFGNNPLYRITLPEEIQQASSVLRSFGLSEQINLIEGQMNRGAELAATEAKDVFLDTVSQMSVSDALGILQGGDNAATHYFRNATEATLRSRYAPIVEQQLLKVGFYEKFKKFNSIYQGLPIQNKPSLDLESHVIDRGLVAMFDKLSKEEALIRQDPLGRGSEFLSKIFTSARNTP